MRADFNIVFKNEGDALVGENPEQPMPKPQMGDAGGGGAIGLGHPRTVEMPARKPAAKVFALETLRIGGWPEFPIESGMLHLALNMVPALPVAGKMDDAGFHGGWVWMVAAELQKDSGACHKQNGSGHGVPAMLS